MKTNLTRIIVLLFVPCAILLCLLACTNPKSDDTASLDFKTASAGNFSMDVPSIMKETKNLNKQAVLQYSNVYKEIYAVVIKEDKQNFIDDFIKLNEYDSTLSPVENYRAVQLKLLNEKITIKNKKESKPVKINNLAAQQVQFDGTVEGIKYEIAYFFTFAEGKTDVYMIMQWTIKDRKQKYASMFDKIAKSIKEN